MSSSVDTLLAGLVDELAQIVGTYADATTEVAPGQFPDGRQWVATFQVSGDYNGTCTLVLDYAGVEAITKILGREDSQSSDAAIAETLSSALTQSAAALAAREPIELALVNVESGSAEPEAATVSYAMSVSTLPEPVSISVTWAAAVKRPAAAAKPQVADTGAPDGERIEDRIDVILDIDLPIVVRFGRTELPIRQLTRLGQGSVIDLGRSPDDPVELLVSDRVVAHGEVVIVGGNYGIRILDVASPSERMRSMEG